MFVSELNLANNALYVAQLFLRFCSNTNSFLFQTPNHTIKFSYYSILSVFLCSSAFDWFACLVDRSVGRSASPERISSARTRMRAASRARFVHRQTRNSRFDSMFCWDVTFDCQYALRLSFVQGCALLDCDLSCCPLYVGTTLFFVHVFNSERIRSASSLSLVAHMQKEMANCSFKGNDHLDTCHTT